MWQMNARQKKKRLKKWAIAHNQDELLYCECCGKKLDIKRNKYALRWETCDAHCYWELFRLYH